MTTHFANDPAGRPSLAQLIQAIEQAVHAAQLLDNHDLQQIELVLGLVQAWAGQHLQTARPNAVPPTAQPLAVSPRQAAKLLGINPPLFYKEVMPHVYSGAILSCQIGRSRLILVDSLRSWLAQAAHAQPANQ